MNLAASIASRFIAAILSTVLLVAAQSARSDEDITHGGARIVHRDAGVFSVGPVSRGAGGAVRTIDLQRVGHGYDRKVDPDVPDPTDLTLNKRTRDLVDPAGRRFGLITLYQVDPPLADLPSREAGIDRGIDMRTPADMVKSVYSNYVSPVFTEDADAKPVPGHPIGHFYVKVEIGGYPTILTGMTTIARADEELVDLTLGQGLGIGGVLLTPQPGRLNAAAEARHELSLRQRRLHVIDGLNYKENAQGRNVGPEFVIEDGNVVFARFKVPRRNAVDALAMFVEYIARGEHRIFGSLINRPHKGTGSGCTPFAMAWLKAAGVIPFVAEPPAPRRVEQADTPPNTVRELWSYLLRTAQIPWGDIGCDTRVGIAKTVAASYTVYDQLFHNETTDSILHAVPGLAEKIRRDRGTVTSTLFAFGALTPLRSLFIASNRNDPQDVGKYGWSGAEDGLRARFWDNGRFSDWIKAMWRRGHPPAGATLVREGRFLGLEIDAMQTARQTEPFFAAADEIKARASGVAARVAQALSCRPVFLSGLH